MNAFPNKFFVYLLQVILAEDNEIRDKLAEHDLHVQTIAEVAPIEVSNCMASLDTLIMYEAFHISSRSNQLVY